MNYHMALFIPDEDQYVRLSQAVKEFPGKFPGFSVVMTETDLSDVRHSFWQFNGTPDGSKAVACVVLISSEKNVGSEQAGFFVHGLQTELTWSNDNKPLGMWRTHCYSMIFAGHPGNDVIGQMNLALKSCGYGPVNVVVLGNFRVLNLESDSDTEVAKVIMNDFVAQSQAAFLGSFQY